jgi:tetratricopeptide (TPR) repeat protein
MRRAPNVARRAVVAALALAAISSAVTPSPAPVAFAAEDAAALRGKFDAAVSAGKDADAQAAGKKLLAEVPEDAVCVYVLRTFLAKGWKWPRLRTSFATLRKWEQDLDAAKEPDLRLALIESVEDAYPKEDAVADGGTLYERAWTQLQAKRYDEAIRLGREYLRRFKDGGNADKVRVVVLAPALLAKSPPETDAARKILREVASDERSNYRERALRALDEMAAGARWIDVADGCPRAAGIGKVVLLTDLSADDDFWKALAPWRDARGAEIVRFRPGRLKEAADALRKIGPEFVAVAVRPAEIDSNLQWDVVELCRDLDGDPMPDFHFGWLVARDAADLRALAERSAKTAPREDAKTAMIGVPASAADVAPFDAVLHFGHGQPTGIDGGLAAADLASAKLPRAPLVVSGACYNGVVGRSWHPCTLQPQFCRPVEVAPNDALSLAWIHAGAIGVLASMEADRGEMAGAEWAWLRETACPLGEAATLDARLACLSVPEDWSGMPRQRAGDRRSLELFDVMLRGQLARCLVGDPSVRILAKPAAEPSVRASARTDETGRVVVEVEPTAAAVGESQFLVVNTLTRGGLAGNAFSERRVFARVEVPAGVAGRLGPPEVSVRRGDAAVPLLRTSVRHEVWGGRRFVCVQVESADAGLAAAGTLATFTFPIAR